MGHWRAAGDGNTERTLGYRDGHDGHEIPRQPRFGQPGHQHSGLGYVHPEARAHVAGPQQGTLAHGRGKERVGNKRVAVLITFMFDAVPSLLVVMEAYSIV